MQVDSLTYEPPGKPFFYLLKKKKKELLTRIKVLHELISKLKLYPRLCLYLILFSPREGNGNLLQYSYLENSMNRGAWWATAYGVAKNQT